MTEEHWGPSPLAFEADGFEQRRILRDLFLNSDVVTATYWSPLTHKRALDYGEQKSLLKRKAGNGYNEPHVYILTHKGHDALNAEDPPPKAIVHNITDQQRALLKLISFPTGMTAFPRSAVALGDGSAFTVAVYGDFWHDPGPWPPRFAPQDVYELRDAGCIASDFPTDERRNLSFHLTDIGRRAIGNS